MEIVKDTVRGDLNVEGKLALVGTVGGNLRAAPGAEVLVHGLVVGAVVVEAGASADIGGRVGSVQGPGFVTVAVGAIVGGRMLRADGTWAPHTETTTVNDSTPRFVLAADGTLTAR